MGDFVLNQPLLGSFVHLPEWSGGGHLAQHPGAPELCACAWVRGPLGGASAVDCVTLDKSCPNWERLALKISSCQKQLSEPRVADNPFGCSSCLQSLLQTP